jgi:hypothetical protein
MNNKKKYSISGSTRLGTDFSNNSPKQITLLDSSFKIIRRAWTHNNTFEMLDLDSGFYDLRLNLSTGEEESIIVDLRNGSWDDIIFDLNPLNREITLAEDSSNFWPLEVHSRVKGVSYNTKIGREKGAGIIKLRILTLIEGKWRSSDLQTISYSSIYQRNFNFSFETTYGISILVLESDLFDSKLICAPQNAKLKLDLKPQITTRDPSMHPIATNLYSDNWNAEALLTLMSNGAMNEAKSFVNADLAEDLLQSKIENPWAAAIGGYYLLKVKDLERLHNWANNLANWFQGLPDGPIIHAWQMIGQGVKSPIAQKKIRSRLLEAQRRGIPLFTEGLRLLIDGLNQLSTIYKGEDAEVEKALDDIRDYSEKVDWSNKNTTINKLGMTLNGWDLPKELNGTIVNNNFKLAKF